MKLFEINPNLQKCFGTSDGEFFYEETDAKSHAKTLNDKEVKTYERGDSGISAEMPIELEAQKSSELIDLEMPSEKEEQPSTKLPKK